MLDVKQIQYWVNNLAAQIHFRMDYQNLANGSTKLLIVEGKTDETFIKGQLRENVACVVANKAFRVGNGLNPQNAFNCKNAIIYVVYGLSQIPMLIACPPGSENWKIYGMIDMDFDNFDDYVKSSRLFVTDTHDLETLMLSTDSTLLQRIDRCPITQEEVNKALFMAYELGRIKAILKAEGIPAKALTAGKNDIPYGLLFDNDCKISLGEVFSFLDSVSDEPMSAEKRKKAVKKIVSNKANKKLFTSDGVWNASYESFAFTTISDFWEVINGHDILALLKYVSSDVALAFSHNVTGLDREFEMGLIERYDYASFTGTQLYSNMKKEDII